MGSIKDCQVPGTRPDAGGGRKRRWLRLLVVCTLLLLALAAAAPTILSQPAICNYLLSRAIPKDPLSKGSMRIDCREASFHWLGGQKIEGLTVKDRSGGPMLTVESLTLDRSLLQLLANAGNLGKLEIVRPLLHLVARPDGSNVEDLLRVLADADRRRDDGSELLPEVRVEIIDGGIEGMAQGDRSIGGVRIAENRWTLSGLNARLRAASRVAGSITASGRGKLSSGMDAEADASSSSADPPAVDGGFQFKLHQDDAGQGRLDLLADHLPLDGLAVWLDRLVPGGGVAGEVSFDGHLQWTHGEEGALVLRSSGRLDGARLRVVHPSLQGDSLQCQRLGALWRLVASRETLVVEQLAVETEWGELTAHGSFDPLRLVMDISQPSDEDVSVETKLDIGRLAVMLPHLLRIRPGVRIDSGRARLAAKSNMTDKGRKWRIDAAVREVAGSDGHNQIRWDEPVELVVELEDGRVSEDPVRERGRRNPHLTRLALHAPFLEASLQAEPRSTAAPGILKTSGPLSFDLEKLATQVGQVVDLSPWQLSGQGSGTLGLAWRDAAPSRVAGRIDLQVTGLHAKSDRWTIDQPQVRFQGDGHYDWETGRLATGKMELASSIVALRSQDVTLAQDPDGQILIHGEVAIRADLERLAAVFSGGEGTQPPHGVQSASGESMPSPSVSPRGTATGHLRFSSGGDLHHLEVTLEGDRLQLVRSAPREGTPAHLSRTEAATLLWNEEHTELAASLAYNRQIDQVRMEKIRLVSQAFHIDGAATIDKCTTEANMRASGTVDYDWDVLTGLLAAVGHSAVEVHGKDRAAFQLSGRIAGGPSGVAELDWSHIWSGSAELGWQEASIYGMPLDAARLQMTLGRGLLEMEPQDLAVGQGRLHLGSRVVLSPLPRRLILPRGPLVTRVRVSPEVSEKMLKYMAPVLANATRVEGQFSLAIDRGEVPLADWTHAELQGKLGIHEFQIAPGPLANEVIALVKQIEAIANQQKLLQYDRSQRKRIVTIEQRTVDFQVAGGRVFHRGLEFQVDGVPIRSSGSVGFDQTLAVTLEVPMMDKWIEGRRLLEPLAGKVLHIPVRGTFQQPQVDQRVVADLSRRMVEDVARGALGNEINRQLDKLFRQK